MTEDNSPMYGWGSNRHGATGTLPLLDSVPPSRIKTSENLVVKHMAGGGAHSVIVDDKNRLWMTGRWCSGSMPRTSSSFILVQELTDVCIAQCGWDSTFAATTDGSVYFCAYKSFEKLIEKCTVQPTQSSDFKKLIFHKSVKNMSVGWSHLILLTNDEEVYTVGKGNSGQLGIGRQNCIIQSPCKVEIPEKVKLVKCGWKFSACLTESSQIYVWGSNSHGQCTLDSNAHETVFFPIHVRIDDPIIDFCCGWSHVICLGESKRLHCWGRNDYYQIKYESKNSQIECFHQPIALEICENYTKTTQIAAGAEHNIVLCDGKLYFWGWNEHRICPGVQNDFILAPQISPMIEKLHVTPTRICSGLSHALAICD